MFDPNGIGQENGNHFGMPYTIEEADVVLLQAPWDVTTSYAAGTSKGPAAILAASPQLDLMDADIENAWKIKIAHDATLNEWKSINDEYRELAADLIRFQESGGMLDEAPHKQLQLDRINGKCEAFHNAVQVIASRHLKAGKIVGVVGGEHSTPLGLMKALAEQHDDFGILQIDAHMDLRVAYEGFEYSHASIMHHASNIPQVQQLVQVGVRDYAPEEWERVLFDQSINVFLDQQLKRESFEGKSFAAQCAEIVQALPKKVYISFDIDGLDPSLCPSTGTPVPGGLSFAHATYLLDQLRRSGKQIIGFDLCEVAPGNDEWDGNVGARILYKLCCTAHFAQ